MNRKRKILATVLLSCAFVGSMALGNYFGHYFNLGFIVGVWYLATVQYVVKKMW